MVSNNCTASKTKVANESCKTIKKNKRPVDEPGFLSRNNVVDAWEKGFS